MVRQRMRGRGCCWSIAGATIILAILPHNRTQSEHAYEYHRATKEATFRNSAKETQVSGYQPGSGALAYLK